jgi:CO dehydrogenase/acetyl-CoA synthase epsilon subunit
MSSKKFLDLSLDKQEKLVEYLMKIKNEAEIVIVDIVKGMNLDITSPIHSIKETLRQIERLL